MGFYRASPWEVDAYRAKADELALRFDTDARRRAAGLVHAPTPGAAAKLEAIVSGEGFFVTTGQQPGLFGGPLYTVYKLLSAVRLAEALEGVLECPVLPLFWIASDDHDWAEANHTHVVDRSNVLQRIELTGEAAAVPSSMRVRRLGPEVEAALDAFGAALPTTEFAGDVLERLREAYRPDRTVAEAFTGLLESLTTGFDVGFVDGGQPGIKSAVAELIATELDRASEHEAALARRARELESEGYHVQVPILEGATNVLYEDEHGRERIFRADDGFVLRRTGRRFTTEELHARLRDEPGRFSANVALRPVVESAVFPTLAYVAGPGEVSYFGQLAPLFDAHGVGMPLVFPRFSVMLIESKIRKVLDKFSLEADDVRPPAHEVAARVLRQELPDAVTDAIAALRRDLNAGYERLIRAAQGIDPTLKGPLQGARNAGYVQLSEAEKKIAHHLKDQNDLGLDQIAKARVNLYPEGQPQERVLNVHQYLVRYGNELLHAIADRMVVRWTPAPAALG